MWISRRTYERDRQKANEYIAELEEMVCRLNAVVQVSGFMNLPPFVPQCASISVFMGRRGLQLCNLGYAIDRQTDEELRRLHAEKSETNCACSKAHAKNGKGKSRGRRSV